MKTKVIGVKLPKKKVIAIQRHIPESDNWLVFAIGRRNMQGLFRQCGYAMLNKEQHVLCEHNGIFTGFTGGLH